MAIDVCSEISSAGISPRISFSYDLNQSDAVSIEDHHRRLDSSLLDSGFDFDFCSGNSFVQELSSADELFSNGKILPIDVKKSQKTTVSTKSTHKSEQPPVPIRPRLSTTENAEKKRLKEFLSMSLEPDEKPTSKSFWQFKRSSSLNCDSARSKGLIRSLQFLSRSNSTGSAPNPKPISISKETQKQNLQKQPSLSRKSSVSSSSSGTYYSYNPSQKPPLKKSCGSNNYGNGVRISPVLNIPPPYISSAAVSFFGFGSLFCNGKVKKKKR